MLSVSTWPVHDWAHNKFLEPTSEPTSPTHAAEEIQGRQRRKSLAFLQQKREESERQRDLIEEGFYAAELEARREAENCSRRRYRMSTEVQVTARRNSVPMTLTPTVSTAVEFCWPYEGKEVALTGTFCQWKKHPMVKEGNTWKATLRLFPGSYQYKFIVDDNWYFDVNKPACTDSEGNTNNFVRVA